VNDTQPQRAWKHHDTAVKLSPVAQRILHKPCDPNLLKLAVEQCHALHRRLHDPGVLQAIGAAVKLPALPRLYWELVREMDNPRADSSSLARIIEQDVAMTARVLQVANSALFSPGRKLSHVREAVTYLGTLPLRSMVLAEKLFEASSEVSTPGFSLARLQAHSLRTAQIASTLVKDPQEKLAAFAAGMLHDIGHLVLAVGLPERYVAVRVRAISQHLTVLDAERRARQHARRDRRSSAVAVGTARRRRRGGRVSSCAGAAGAGALRRRRRSPCRQRAGARTGGRRPLTPARLRLPACRGRGGHPGRLARKADGTHRELNSSQDPFVASSTRLLGHVSSHWHRRRRLVRHYRHARFLLV
jgi:hypothetical protein